MTKRLTHVIGSGTTVPDIIMCVQRQQSRTGSWVRQAEGNPDRDPVSSLQGSCTTKMYMISRTCLHKKSDTGTCDHTARIRE
jgi:hypothetical protein